MQHGIPNNKIQNAAPLIKFENYTVAEPDVLETPAMLLFQDVMDNNIKSVCELVGGGENLMAHVKTHKSEAVVRKQMEQGITGFKCATLKELEMVLEAGAEKAILTYPQCQEIKIERFCDLAASYPDAWVVAIVSSPFHINLLATVAARREQTLRVMLDLDVGMHRTGIGFGPDADKLYREIDAHPYLEASGLHLYDGHENYSDVVQREATAQGHIESLKNFQQQIEADGMPVPCVVAGGSWSFPYYARTEGMYGSPGTFIYWDAGYSRDMPDMPFRCAALVLTQVVDRYPDVGSITTDLGCKGISSDLLLEERATLLGHDTAEMVWQSEEHAMFRIEGELPAVGDYLLAVPGHICPTTIRYPGIHVIDTAGEVVDYYLHTARDRQ
ncbi:MAG: alanine racemase [Proteobacteria bacterium]|nr:alanine racemase [Pseudomonadota bacterium]